MKKILFVMMSLYNGGAERSLVNLLSELPKEKYEIDLLLFRREGLFLSQIPQNVTMIDQTKGIKAFYGPLSKAGALGGVKIFGTAISHLLESRGSDRAQCRWKYFYAPFIKKINTHYDVAVAYITGDTLGYVIDKVTADKKIVWVHNDYREGGFSKKYDYPYFKKVDEIVTISETCEKILKEEFPEFNEKIYCIPNITSSKLIRSRGSAFYPEEYQKNKVNILSIGRLTEQKGFDIAIEAAKIMKKAGYRFMWHIIGTGELEESLDKQIATAEVDDCIRLIGARENPYPYIQNCTLFVQPSRWEGKSVVLDEAKILAAPIVATNYPTVMDQIHNDVEGKITNMSAEALAQGIIEMLENSNCRAKIRNNLLSHEYGNQNDVIKYEKIFDVGGGR